MTSKDLGFEIEDLIGNPIEFYAREGARMLLEAAFQYEITDILERMPYERKADAPQGYSYIQLMLRQLVINKHGNKSLMKLGEQNKEI